MKYVQLLLIHLVFFLFLNCSHEEFMDGGERTMLNVYTEQVNISRIALNTKGICYWTPEDSLGVTTANAKNHFSKFLITSGVGTNRAIFMSENLDIAKGYAVYPYNKNHYIEGNTLFYSLPKEFFYDNVDSEILSSSKENQKSFHIPMYGSIKGNQVTLHHLGGMLYIKVDELPLGKNLKISVSSSQRMNGLFPVNLSDDRSVLVTQKSTNTENSSVSVLFNNMQDKKPGSFLIPIPTGGYENMRIKLYKDQYEISNSSIGDVTIASASLKTISIRNHDISYE